MGDTRFGSQYVLGDLVGRGAMGRVHIASSSNSDEPVAIKLLRDDLASQPDIVGRFLQESHVLRSVHHPNVVMIHDLVAESGRLGIVMDYVNGGDLRSAVQFPTYANDALHIIAQIAAGLSAVHDAGIVHRDMKPENVLAEWSGDRLRLKITDFGVSRLMSQATRTTSLIGTPVYMAPEIADGSPPSPAVDIYALGVILFEALTGRVPFSADSHYALVRAHMEDPVPRPNGLPDDIWQLLASMLAKTPNTRPTAHDVARIANDLARTVGDIGPFTVAERQTTEVRRRPTHHTPIQALTPDTPPTTTPANPTRRRTLIATALAATALIITTTAILWPNNTPNPTASAGVPLEVDFKPVEIQDNIINRRWVLDGSTVRATITVTNNGTDPSEGDHYEVIPKTVAANVVDITFEPIYTDVIQADPVVRYSLTGLEPGQQKILRWSADIGDKATQDGILQQLANDQQRDEQQFFEANPELKVTSTLASLTVEPNTLSLGVADNVTLTLTGRMSDESVPAPELLAGVQWESSDPNVAIVDANGRVVALNPGSATITVTAGDIKVATSITVNPLDTTPPAAPAPTPTNKPATTPAPAATPAPTVAAPVVNTPSAPVISGVTTGNGTLTVNFNPPSNNGGAAITNYQYSTNGGSSWVTRSPSGTSSPITISGLANGTSYSIAIRALNSAGPGAGSSSVNATPVTAPSAPSISSISAGNGSLTINFSSPSSNGGSPVTNIEYSVNGGSWTSRSPASTSSPLTIGSLANGTSYSIALRALNAQGAGPASAPSSGTPVAPPAPAPPPAPSAVVTVSKGSPFKNSGCQDASCALIRVSISNLPGPYNIRCYGNGSNFLTYNESKTVSEYCLWGSPGRPVFVIVRGSNGQEVWSNTINW